MQFEIRCRDALSAWGFAAIEEMAKGNIKTDKKWALEIMLDRGFGKPPQNLDVESRTGPIASEPGEIADSIADIIRPEVGAGGGGGGSGGPNTQPGEDKVVCPERGTAEVPR
jgi:hypothetical protein